MPCNLTLLGLNVDVLAIIISYLPPRDAVALSCTCKAAHAISIDPALHTVILDHTTEQIQKFRDHLLAVESRPHVLKSLTLTKAVTWEIDPHASGPAGALADIVEQAKDLQFFSCGNMDDMIVASNMRLVSALTSRTSMRALQLQYGGQHTVKIITEVESPYVRELIVDLTFVSKMPWNNLFAPLTRYQHLTTLSISKLTNRLLFPFPVAQSPQFAAGPILPSPATNIQHLTPETTPIIPSVRTLSFFSTFIPMALAATMFPNVENLTFRTDRLFRSFYIAEQAVRQEFPSLSACWHHTLAEAHIDVADCRVWPLTCRVRWLDFNFLPGGWAEEALDAVTRTKPHVISVAYRIDPDNTFWLRLPMIASELRFMDTRILELSGHRRRYVLMHLSRFPALAAIFLCVRAHYQAEDYDAEVETIARELAERNRKLQYIGISFTDGRFMRYDDPVWNEERLGSRWWKVHRDEGHYLGEGTSVKVIPTEVGLKIREYMYEADYDSPVWEERLSTFV
ncbi:hypothetical protein BD309DRAFT_996203 [Dichomitus squalens]|uniref:F-box domain-containing protein n=1 Tax=Dichomitus squalens TaxID=114155 RepID=A0A4Q9QC88_9APHY|nr:hypothetical protein BD309DRAFT_996203 [Dichomitus squalens]TBU65347.1 hypothetical protein BD310DRAFT_836024 [Dichomitus squalens]